jgi:acyl-coenzyme A synthetase/AMP-(fatty) acid ligase
MLLFDDALLPNGPPPSGARAVPLSECLAGDDDMAPVAQDPDAPCMVHYTSGSTGRPKGIVLSSYGILTRTAMGIANQHLGPADRFLVPTTISDASSVAAVLSGIASGGTKLVVSVAAEGVGGLLRLAAREGVTVLSSTAALLRTLRGLALLPAALARVRLLRFGGVGVTADDVAAWRARLPAGCEISHAYGSSEALLVSEWRVPPDLPAEPRPVGVGRMLPGADHALLDADGTAVADGEAGQMVLRGRHIALGEWQAGRLVPGRMADDPDLPGMRVFPTGDLLRCDAGGVMHFAGRADRQVKVNGVRVELAEIEAVLRAEPGVRDAAVIQQADGTLHGFVAAPPDAGMPDAGMPDAELPDAELQERLLARLRTSLPSAMRPPRLTRLDALPLLPSGKHDTQAMRARAGSPSSVQS